MDAEVKALKNKGVAFEHYEMPGSTLEGDVHVFGDMRVAWFKDPDGNILNLINPAESAVRGKVVPELARAPAGPALESTIERARLGIAEQDRDFEDRELQVPEVQARQIGAHLVDERGEARVLLESLRWSVRSLSPRARAIDGWSGSPSRRRSTRSSAKAEGERGARSSFCWSVWA